MQRYEVKHVPNHHPLTSEDRQPICIFQNVLADIDDAREEESCAVNGKHRGRKELMEEY